MDGILDSMDVRLSKLWEVMKYREALSKNQTESGTHRDAGPVTVLG